MNYSKGLIRKVAAGGGGACMLIGGLTALPIAGFTGVIVTLGLTAATAAGLYMVVPEDVVEAKIQDTPQSPDSHLPLEAQKAITTGRTKLASIRDAAMGIRAPNTKRAVNKICSIGDEIIEDFRKDPDDIKVASVWLNVHLDEFHRIVKNYAGLSQQGNTSLEAQEVMSKFDTTLDLIETEWAKLLKDLINNNIQNLSVDMKVLSGMIKNEGL